ncbi:hypothetical protein EDC96DRAFT_566703 [Choanephora cucurbitarum]|nr:hypothetical protein EDC96DRAFT_566703 [Choanephora cucurbitarum]
MSQTNSCSSPAADINMDVMVTDSLPVVPAPVVPAPVVPAPVVPAPVVSAPVVSAPVVSAPAVSVPVVSAPVASVPVVSAPVDASSLREAVNQLKVKLVLFGNQYHSRTDEGNAAALREQICQTEADLDLLTRTLGRIDGQGSSVRAQCLPSSLLVDRFKRAMPSTLLEKVILARAALPEHAVWDIKQVVSVALRVFKEREEMGPGGASFASGFVAGSSTGTSKWANKSGTKVSKRSSSSGRHCELHKVNTHSTAGCKALASISSSLVAGSGATSSVSLARHADKGKGKERKCYKCGALGWSKAHVCNSGVPSVGKNFGMMTISASFSLGSLVASAGSSAQAPVGAALEWNSFAAGNSAGSFAAGTSAAGTPVAAGTLSAASTSSLSLGALRANESASVAFGAGSSAVVSSVVPPSEDDMEVDEQYKSNALIVPLVVENVAVYALVDSGATFSVVHPSFFSFLSLPLVPASGSVQLGHELSSSPRLGQCRDGLDELQ